MSVLLILLIPWLGRTVPDNRAWGVNLWSYLPAWFAWAALATGLALLAVGLARARGRELVQPTRTARSIRNTIHTPSAHHPHGRIGPSSRHSASPSTLWPVTGSVLLAVILERFREKLQYLGDTHLRLDAIRRVVAGEPAASLFARLHAGPLDELVQLRLPIALSRILHLDPLTAGQEVPALIGLIFALACVWTARGMAQGEAERWLATAALWTGGYLQLFAGYQETYGLQITLLLLWYGAVIREAREARAPLLSHVFFGLAILAHRDSVLLLPAHAWAAWRWRSAGSAGPASGRTSSGPGLRRVARPLAGLLFAAACMALLAVRWAPEVRQDLAFLLGHGSAAQGRGDYPLLSPTHAVNVANEFFLLCPLSLTALALALRLRPSPPGGIRALLFAGAPFWLLLALVRSNQHGLGAIRDWDAYSPAGIFAALVAAQMLMEVSRRIPRARVLAWSALLASGFQVAGWIWVNASETRALERARAIAYAPPPMPVYPATMAFDALARVYRERGEYARAADAMRGAAMLSPNVRYIWGAGLDFYQAGDSAGAAAMFRWGARQDTSFRRSMLRAGQGPGGARPHGPLYRMVQQAVEEAGGSAR